MKQRRLNNQRNNKIQGFNLIEILLAITFFSLAFSGMLLGSTAMVNTSTNGTKINEDAAVLGSMFTGINAQSAYIEASASQLTPSIASSASILSNPAGDISNRQALVIPDSTTATTDNRRIFFDRLVFSDLNTPDVKTSQINIYPTAEATTPTRSIIRKLDRREECFAMGVNGSLYLPSFGQPCTGWSSGNNVPRARAMNLTGAGGTQNYNTDFRINGALHSLVSANRFSLFDATAGAPPVAPTDKGHQVANGTTAEYFIEATPNVAYNLVIGLRKQTNAQIYTVSVNTDPTFLAQPIPPINCNQTARPRNCQRETMSVSSVDVDVNNGQPFNVKFENIMPYTIGNQRVFHIRIVSTNGIAANNPAIIHFIKKELANN
jgi:Tfp pilus assembly protein PilV